ncbi:MAG: PIN domain-containing protein [Clostridiales bacterium]|nr:PIN domain-containing protein [Clostridiales bacterium]
MMILLDTNIIMDALQERQPFDAAAKDILWRAQNGEIKCCFTANAATDIFYLYSKARDLKSAKNALSYLLANYAVVSVAHEDCVNALSLPMDDFEDALVVACAKRAGVDYIVTRDEKLLLEETSVPLITPDNLLEKLK